MMPRSHQELKAGDTAAALTDIHKAYDLDPQPELLIQIADCEEAAGHNANVDEAAQAVDSGHEILPGFPWGQGDDASVPDVFQFLTRHVFRPA